MSVPRPSATGRSLRGVALLVVLAALILAVMSASILCTQAALLQVNREVNQSAVLAVDILDGLEPAIVDWLAARSSKVVVPPDTLEPRVEVLHHALELDNINCEIQVTAWDQCGMAPWLAATSGTLFRGDIPEDVMRRIDDVSIELGVEPGLDLLVDLSAGGLSVYPEAPPTPALAFGQVDIRESRSEAAHVEGPALGALIATHQTNRPRLNVNTAPPELLRHVMREAGLGGFEQVMEARRNGKPATVKTADVEARRQLNGLSFVTSSDLWSIRIDIRVGSLRRSWWAVYERTNRSSSRSAGERSATVSTNAPFGSDSRHPGAGVGAGAGAGVRPGAVKAGGGGRGWECVQRLAITD